jgi:hypothetical protein
MAGTRAEQEQSLGEGDHRRPAAPPLPRRLPQSVQAGVTLRYWRHV